MTTFPTTPLPTSVIKSPAFSTLVVNYGNTIEQRVQLNSTERYTFQLRFSARQISDMEAFIEFFLARKGSYESFYFQNTAEAYRSGTNVVWKQSTAYSLGDIIRPVTPNGRSYRCTVAGTSGGSEPTWGTTVNGTTADGGVTWTENTYTVRFAADTQDFDYFYRSLINQGTIALTTVSE